ncbi:MAG: DUF835 domain-containing protein [Thermoplasmata archaeon]
MEFNPYIFPPAISLVIHILFLLFILRKSKSNRVRFYFSLFFLTVILWAGAETALRSFPVTAENYLDVWYSSYALACAKLMGESLICLILTSILLSFNYPVKSLTDKQSKILGVILSIAFLIYTYITLFTPLLVRGLLYFWAGYGVDIGPLIAYLSPILALIFVIIFYNWWKAYTDAKSIVERMQIKYMSVGAIIFAIGVSITGIPNLPPIYGVPTSNFWILFMDAFWVYAAVKYKVFTVEAVVENGVKEVRVPDAAKNIEAGDVVLVVSPDGKKGFETFRYLAGKMPGLCITTKHPKVVRTEFEFSKLPVIWISEITTKENAIEPSKLEFEISYHIYSFLREGEKRVVYLDDLEYLSTVNGFQEMYAFLKSVADEAASKNSVLIFSVSMETFDATQRSQIKSIASREIEQEETPRRKTTSEFSLKEGYAIVVEALGEQRERIKSKISGYRVLGISAHFPKKFSKGFPEGTEMECVWITETSVYEKAISPRKMEFEVSQEIISFIKANGEKGLVYIDAIPSFLIVNEFTAVLKFVKDIVDIAQEYNAKVIFEIPPELFKPEQKALFERRMDMIYSAKR